MSSTCVCLHPHIHLHTRAHKVIFPLEVTFLPVTKYELLLSNSWGSFGVWTWFSKLSKLFPFFVEIRVDYRLADIQIAANAFRAANRGLSSHGFRKHSSQSVVVLHVCPALALCVITASSLFLSTFSPLYHSTTADATDNWKLSHALEFIEETGPQISERDISLQPMLMGAEWLLFQPFQSQPSYRASCLQEGSVCISRAHPLPHSITTCSDHN